MKTIHKFRIELGKEPTRLTLKEGFRVVRCEYLVSEKGVYIWVEQSLKVTKPNVDRHFRVAFSGEPVPDRYHYLGTALDPFGPEAYHVFDVPADTLSDVEATSEQHLDPALLRQVRFRPLAAAG